MSWIALILQLWILVSSFLAVEFDLENQPLKSLNDCPASTRIFGDIVTWIPNNYGLNPFNLEDPFAVGCYRFAMECNPTSVQIITCNTCRTFRTVDRHMLPWRLDNLWYRNDTRVFQIVGLQHCEWDYRGSLTVKRHDQLIVDSTCMLLNMMTINKTTPAMLQPSAVHCNTALAALLWIVSFSACSILLGCWISP